MKPSAVVVVVIVVVVELLFLRPRATLAQSAQNVSPPPSLASRIAVSGAIGYAYPVGSTEPGNETRDVSYGLVPLGVAGTYDLGPLWRARLRVRYSLHIHP